MTIQWLIVNSASGSYAPTLVEAVLEAFADAGEPIDRIITIPDDDMPDAAQANTAKVDRVIIFTGDGTVSSAVDALEGWNGELLILPGGTMNLLARKLHGEADPITIVEKMLAGEGQIREMPVAVGCGHRSLVGIIAGPTTAWGDVREDIRHIDLVNLVASVPQALHETLHGHMVSLEGDKRSFPAIFIEPRDGMLSAMGIQAATAAEIAKHGLAWLTGTFLGGPSEPLTAAVSITVTGDATIGLLVDGERASAASPCQFTLETCPLHFVATQKPD